VKLIELKGVSKRFKKLSILEDVNFSIEEGDIIGIIGKSGSGKTTLLNLITGFIEPSKGDILHSFNITKGVSNLNKDLDKIKPQIGFAPQHNSFYPKLTVKENLLHFGQLYGLKKSVILNNVEGLLNATELSNHSKKIAEHLSGGMQKRLDIACSLIHKPKILVLDEPTSDLDPMLQIDIMDFLVQVNKQGVTLVIASHHLNLLEAVCNKIAIVHQGRVETNGLLEDVKRPYLKDKFTISLKPGKNKERFLSILDTLPVEQIVDKGDSIIIHPRDAIGTVNGLLHAIQQEKLHLYDLDLRKPSLKEIFEEITLKK
jgi:ABC-2 type transport system ATP-binding protein